MFRFNVSRRFRMVSDNNAAQKDSEIKLDNIEKLNTVDDKVLSYLAESIIREMAAKGILQREFRNSLYRTQRATAVPRDLPAVSLGPSGIKGCYQKEI